MNERPIKQFTIALIFLIIVVGVSYTSYNILNPDPTCYDQIQNQSEEGIDCGTVCSNTCDPVIVPLQLINGELVPVGEEFDLVLQVRNPNVLHGAKNVSYDIILTDAENKTSVIHGSFYILPLQTKYIIKSRLASSLTSWEMVIKDATWHKVTIADLKVDFPLLRELHETVSLPGVKYQVEGTLENRSDFDFDQIDVTVLLIDSLGSVKAVNTTTINTFLSKSQRYFKVTWPYSIVGEGLTPQVQATTNVFNNSNFIRRYGTQEEFQKYQ